MINYENTRLLNHRTTKMPLTTLCLLTIAPFVTIMITSTCTHENRRVSDERLNK